MTVPTHARPVTRLAALLCTAALAGCATTVGTPVAPDANTAPSPANDGAPAGSKRFGGTVQAIDNGCFADGTCSVTVDGTVVVTLTGWSRDAWGQRDPELKVGDRVDVACRPTAEGCTLNGDAGYYVRPAR